MSWKVLVQFGNPSLINKLLDELGLFIKHLMGKVMMSESNVIKNFSQSHDLINLPMKITMLSQQFSNKFIMTLNLIHPCEDARLTAR